MRGRVGLTRQSTSGSQALPLKAGQQALRDRHAGAGRLHGGRPNRSLQWLLEGRGWSLLRAGTDLLLLCAAVVVALGGPAATLHVSAVAAPLLAIPPIAMLALYVRGLYRVRIRALILDGIVPALSAVSVAAMAAATIGLPQPAPKSMPAWNREKRRIGWTRLPKPEVIRPPTGAIRPLVACG